MLTIIISLALLDIIIIYANYKLSKSRNAKSQTGIIEYPTEVSQLHYNPIDGFYYKSCDETQLT